MIELRWKTKRKDVEDDLLDLVLYGQRKTKLQYRYLIEQEETGYENWSQWFDVEEVEE